MNLYDEFSFVVEALQDGNIRFAVVGGVALAFYDQPRFTRDIDFLMHSGDAAKVTEIMKKLGYFESAEAWDFQKVAVTLRRFVKTAGDDFMSVDILVGRSHRLHAIINDAV
ncbi:MAG: nucleotidyl transferase AbiEii/AbiGii toxin family protein, partial [Candidatus Wallbacteria bacterium]|nr:nucleotidyl transferase AbiEii/AbiGii toxin family protein [Candidatus Wallbacteria bacterium]